MKKKLAILTVLLYSISYLNAQCSAGYNASIATDNSGQVTFTNTSVAGTGVSFIWSYGDGTFDSIANPPIHTYSASGAYYACITVSDSLGMYDTLLGCNNTYCNVISVSIIHPTDTCHAYFYIHTDSITGVALNNLSSGAITDYYWDFGDGTSSTVPNPVNHIYTDPGYHSICLTTTNPATMCNSTYCDTVMIPSCYATYTYTRDSIGNGVSFYGNSTGRGDSYFWEFGDGSTSTLQNPYHAYTSNGTYVIYMTTTSSTDSSCHRTTSGYISLYSLCDANFYIAQDSVDLYTFSIYNHSFGTGGTTYLWDFGDGTTSTLEYPSHTYASSSEGVLLCLTVTNTSLTCSDTYCDSIIPGVERAGVFSVHVVSPTGITEKQSIISSLENYPNPFSNSTTINYSINKDVKVVMSIVDVLGNTIIELENENKPRGKYTVTWNAENIAQGIYLLQIKVDNTITTKKIIVTN